MGSQKITPSLWFDKNAEEAVNFYVDVFQNSPHKSANSRIVTIARYEEGMNVPGMPEMKGKIITAVFELNGQRFMALDGGPLFNFSQAISFYIDCEDQEEVDYFWEKLYGEEEPCGWMVDKFGLAWQIVPRRLEELLGDPDREKANRVMDAMLKMKKIVIKDLEEAAAR
jgi:predicted 3-demethylubiquinone-9 3-methyltransferase (glyoxalase superfamily)